MKMISNSAFIWFFIILVYSGVYEIVSVETEGNEISHNEANYQDNNNDNNTKGDTEVTLKEVEKNLKSVIRTMLGQVFPIFFDLGLQSTASTSCLVDLANFYFGIKRLEPWAFKMLDSNGKPSSGLLEGTSTALGDYDECLDVVVGGGEITDTSRTGEYCLLEIKPPEPVLNALKDFQVKNIENNYSLATTGTFLGFLRDIRSNPNHVMFRLGLCMPSSCSEYDVQDLINLATKDVDFPANVKRCESKSDFEYQSHEFIILSILALFLAIIVIATVISICFDCMSSDNSSVKPDQNAKCAKAFGLFSKLSLCQSIPKLLECNVDGDAFDVIRGMKVLTVFFAIYMHTYGLPHPLHLYRFRDTLNLSKFMNDILFETIANASVGVDTIFFLAGFICIYNRWRQLKRPGVIFYILKFIFLNYIRMVALQVLVICLFFLTPILGSGPLWQEFVEEPLNNCSEKWWMNLLFIQNFLGPYDSCLYHTWVLAAMMQIFVATTVVVWLMNRWPVLGILSNVFLILLTIVAVATVTAIFDYPATFAMYFYDYRVSKHMWKNLYVQSYTHMGPYCIGMLVAYFVAESSPRKIQRHVSFLLWLASFVTCSAVIFGLHPYHDGRPMDRGLAIFYAAVHRPSWALAIGWIVYACATGHGGIVNSFLSWKFFVPLERLCYLAYLLHVPLMYYQGGIQRERVYMGHYNQVMSFVSYAVTSFFLSFICYLIFQVPYEVLEGFIFRKQGGNIWQVDPSASSEQTLEDAEKSSDNGSSTEGNSKVLYNRSSQGDKF